MVAAANDLPVGANLTHFVRAMGLPRFAIDLVNQALSFL
jgi:hypothetical protein